MEPDSGLKLIKQVARTLRYRSLPDLIGQELLISDRKLVAQEVQSSLLTKFSYQFDFLKPETKYIEGAIAKYGLIDLTFSTSADLFGTDYEHGIPLLKKLNFLKD